MQSNRTPFLDLVARHILADYEDQLKDVWIIFPNRRSILFFNSYLSKLVKKPVWAPKCFNISEFIQSFTSLQKADNLQLLFELHQIYCQVRKSSESFDNFYFWGEIMLGDFDDIDKYLVNPESLFKNITALKNITDDFEHLSEEQREAIRKFWGIYLESRQSSHHKEFSDIWSAMFEVYTRYNQKLKAVNLAYEGMIYREVAQLFQSPQALAIEAKKVAFVGFNALNECEKKLFGFFEKQGKALFYWDYEPEYLENRHEAGFFVRQNLVNFPQSKGFSAFSVNEERPEIELISLPSQVGQAKLAAQLLENAGNEPEKNAILLTDENLLMPVLHALPNDIEDVNITMGYPVKNASLSSLLETLGKLYSNIKQLDSGTLFYYKYVVETLTHPYVLKSGPDNIHALIMDVFRKNQIYIESGQVAINPLLQLVFKPLNQGLDFLNRLKDILQFFALNGFDNNSSESPGGIESEALSTIFISLTKLSETLEKIGSNFELGLTIRILRKVISSLSIPFEGEPLKGIQLMGFLESRALDFENLIILGVNEGNLPKIQSPVSFIPYNLRHGYNLPTPEYRDAMYAYYFYRIIHRAKKVHLVYSTASGSMGASEMSRYIRQIMYSGNYKLVQKVQTFNIVPVAFPAIELPKTENVMAKLLEYVDEKMPDKFLSPSALTTYIECQARFYFRYIEGLKEFEEPGEEIDPAVFGSVLHSAINAIYQPFVGKLVEKESLKELLKHKDLIEKEVLKALDSLFLRTNKGENLVPEGRNFLIFRILTKYIRQIISFDAARAPFTIKGLEERIIATIDFSQGDKRKLNIGGIIDRIDFKENTNVVIDYKTGKPETSFKNIEELFVTSPFNKYKKEIFQTLLYSILYKKNRDAAHAVNPMLYVTRALFDSQYDPRLKLEKNSLTDIEALESEFMERLSQLVEEIFNPELAFVQTEDILMCRNCAFRKLCNK